MLPSLLAKDIQTGLLFARAHCEDVPHRMPFSSASRKENYRIAREFFAAQL